MRRLSAAPVIIPVLLALAGTALPAETPGPIIAAPRRPANRQAEPAAPEARETMKQQPLVYVGTYTGRGSEGIYVYRFDARTGALQAACDPAPVRNPSFLALHPSGRFLYAVSETGRYGEERSGAVVAFALDPDTGALAALNERPSGGTFPCHLTLDRTARVALVANYGSGTVAVFPVEADGRLGERTDLVVHEGSGKDPRRQKEPHAHSVTVSPDNRFVSACDLGIDKIMVYRLDAAAGKLAPGDPPFVAAAPGAGPRHFCFHPGGTFAYVINELDSTVTAFMYDATRGRLEPRQTLPTLSPDFEGRNTCADIHVRPDGRFLYGSNRGDDSVAVYRIEARTGELAFVGRDDAGGKTPRNFAIDPTGRFLLAAHQDSDSVVVFRIDPETGRLGPAGHKLSVSRPVCIRFLVPGP